MNIIEVIAKTIPAPLGVAIVWELLLLGMSKNLNELQKFL
tara:strand:+ start:521 stop:640 length:120 start_codon:yes stop_codon:yes gene_type:complete